MAADRLEDAEYVVNTGLLDEVLCWRLLARSWIGRVAFVHQGEPIALPVNCAVFEDKIIFRTGEESSLYALGAGAVVAFEADHTDRIAESGWSVVVKGRLWEVTDPTERARLAELDMHPWAAGVKDRWMKIVSSEVTGRIISRHLALPEGIRAPYMTPD